MMRAFVLNHYGGPEETELRDVAKPEPGPGEVLIRVHAAALNPVDYKIRKGALPPIYRYSLPAVMGKDFAGTVAARGANSNRFAEGARVFGCVAQEAMGGAFAEYVTVKEQLLAEIPGSLDYTSAAAVPLAGLTALQCLRDELKVKPGQCIFISGGAGGVGTFAIQIAKWLGAHVATTASPSFGGVLLVRSLGADQIIDYSQERFERLLRDFDGALDLVGGDTLERSFAVLKRGGTVVSIAGMPEPKTALKDLGRGPDLAMIFWLASLPIRLQASSYGARYRCVVMHPSGADLAELAGLIDAGKLKVIVDSVFSFAKIGEALAYLEKGHAKGKVVVRIANE